MDAARMLEAKRMQALELADAITATMNEPGIGTPPEDVHYGHVGDAQRILDLLAEVARIANVATGRGTR